MMMTMIEANRVVEKAVEHNPEGLQDAFSDCQESAILIGTIVEEQYMEYCPEISRKAIRLLEDYCENIYQMSTNLTDLYMCRKLSKVIRKELLQLEHIIRFDFPKDRLEVVFLPYKASMWDSLESVWKAAVQNENTDAYVIPIPYYDKNPDSSLKQEHYEIDQYPSDIPVIDYRKYCFEERMPDIIFIHNPYDGANYVTTIHPFFYSKNLKQYTPCLVYIPYYSTAGGMSEAQALCPVYLNADYIVIQAEKYRQYFDPGIPDEKFLPFGSPKFDSVIHKCQQKPQAPDEWVETMQGRKVYFYNTSLTGMLQDTEAFLKKMQYVFDCFRGREDTCLLWRPHPLLETTFRSMRGDYIARFEELKQEFISEKIGIYDATPDIETAIAYSDAYIGDAGTSVTSLFGVVGKPLFILDNKIHRKPDEEDWKGLVYYMGTISHQNERYVVTYGNKLYYSPANDFHYQFYCDLSEYAGGNYYSAALERNGYIYVCPANAEHILVLDKQKKEMRKIMLPHECEQRGAFSWAFDVGQYIFLLPSKYSSLVRLNTQTNQVSLVKDVGNFNYGMVNGTNSICGRAYHKGKLFFINVAGDQFLIIDIETLESQIRETGFMQTYQVIIPESSESDFLWLLPFEGTKVIRWNYVTDERREYDVMIDGLKSYYLRGDSVCDSKYFSSVAVAENMVFFAPMWGNMFVRLDLISGEAQKWNVDLDTMSADKDYFPSWSTASFVRNREDEHKYRLLYVPTRSIYDVDLVTGKLDKVEVFFSKDEVLQHIPGFAVESQWMQYCCNENAFHTLEDFLNGTMPGEAFNRERQLEEFEKINASIDGRCGERIYGYLRERLEAAT